jgi:hypothetical protein
VDRPLSAADARRLAKEIIENGTIGFTGHAEKEMAKDNLAAVDAINVLRGGAYSEAEWENGAWRHQAYTQRIVVVIEFESESELTVITAWRKS